MSRRRKRSPLLPKSQALAKCPSGIQGLDEITGGGLPCGRPTLVCGGPGTGKSLLGLQFLAHGALAHNEPGVLMTFEERATDIATNARSVGIDLDALVRRGKLRVDRIVVNRNEIIETGQYDLDGLFIRVKSAIDKIGARRVVLDTIEALFGSFSNGAIVRAELGRLFDWLKQLGMTAVITAERGDGSLTRHGLEEYVSDCVILLDQRVVNEVAERRLRVVKYRGSAHGGNEYPFVIDGQGITLLPVTSIRLDYRVPSSFVSSGVADLDHMLGGRGFYRGGLTLVTGAAGTGKSSLCAHFVDAACRRGERCLYFHFEEPSEQIIRNMHSIGLDLGRWTKRGLLDLQARRPASHTLESHLIYMLRRIQEAKPRILVLDPVSALGALNSLPEVRSMVGRLVAHLKEWQISTLFTSLTEAAHPGEQSEVGISSLVDTWILVRDLESLAERTRGLYIIKSRGMAHSHQVREMLITDHGLRLTDVLVGPDGILTGAQRVRQQLKDQAEAEIWRTEILRRQAQLARRRSLLDSQIAALRAEFEAQKTETEAAITAENLRLGRQAQTLLLQARKRQNNSHPGPGAGRKKTLKRPVG